MRHIASNGRAVVLAAAVLALGAGLGRAQTTDCIDVNALPPTPNGGRIINAPGNYCLTADLFVPSGNGITIAMFGVTLDLKGFRVHTVFYTDIGIYALNRSRVTVRNGTVEFFQHGLVFANDGYPWHTDDVVEDMHFLRNGTSAINVAGVGALVRRNVITDLGSRPGDSWGIGLLGSAHRVLDNDIVEMFDHADTVARGIWVNHCRDVMLVNNRISRTEWGIVFDASSGIIRDNTTFQVSIPYLNLSGYGYTDAGNNH